MSDAYKPKAWNASKPNRTEQLWLYIKMLYRHTREQDHTINDACTFI